MDNIKNERSVSIMQQLAATYLTRESNGLSLITVTSVSMSRDGRSATIFFTVFPESSEKSALEFAGRHRQDFKEYIKKNSRINRIPNIEFKIDLGEKNRQKIDRLSNEH